MLSPLVLPNFAPASPGGAALKTNLANLYAATRARSLELVSRWGDRFDLTPGASASLIGAAAYDPGELAPDDAFTLRMVGHADAGAAADWFWRITYGAAEISGTVPGSVNCVIIATADGSHLFAEACDQPDARSVGGGAADTGAAAVPPGAGVLVSFELRGTLAGGGGVAMTSRMRLTRGGGAA